MPRRVTADLGAATSLVKQFLRIVTAVDPRPAVHRWITVHGDGSGNLSTNGETENRTDVAVPAVAVAAAQAPRPVAATYKVHSLGRLRNRAWGRRPQRCSRHRSRIRR